VLDAGDRHRRRITLKGARGTEFLLDLDEAVALRDGDGIMLDDGAVVLVTGEAEPLAEIAVRTPLALVQLRGISAIAIPMCKFSATSSVSAAIMCWRRWLQASAPR